MGAQLRVYRQKIKSIQATKKITRAFELIATSRMVKAQQRSQASLPYTKAITRAASEVATYSHEDHPLTREKRDITRSAILLITSDRGLAGAYSHSVIKEAEQLAEKLRGENKEVLTLIAGRKGISHYTFRHREIHRQWNGFSDSPSYEVAQEIANTLIDLFLVSERKGGVDEIHIVSTKYVNMVTQTPEVVRLLPLEVVEAQDESPEEREREAQGATGPIALYSFEPSMHAVLDALLPAYVRARVFNALLSAAASELAARQRAMKSATDNAEDLIKRYTRLANTARQAEITQEISEIVGGAGALAAARSN